ncbi:right-handed parallel beta-helix repeat-containing protein [Rhizobium binxianense]
MPSVLRTLIWVAVLGCAVPASGAEIASMRPAVQNNVRLAMLAAAARNPDVALQSVFDGAASLAPVSEPQNVAATDEISARSSQMRLSRSRVDLPLRRIGMMASEGFVDAVLKSQPDPDGSSIVIESGLFSLGDVASELESRGYGEYLERTADGYVAHRPIFIWSGAALSLGAGDVLKFDGGQGAFLINAGRLKIDGATVEGILSGGSDGFRPFVLTTFGGSATISGSRFSALGSGSFPESSGVAFATRKFVMAEERSFVSGNLFQDVAGLSLIDAEGIDVSANRFVGSGGIAISLKNARGLSIKGNAIVGTTQSHAIKISNGSRDIAVSDNVIIDNAGQGIFVNDGSISIAIAGNLVAANRSTGISIDTTACVRVANNAIIENKTRGVAVRASLKTVVEGNMIAGNELSGLAVSGQYSDSPLKIAHNRFIANRFGIAGDDIGAVSLVANDFDRQFPRLASGDFAGEVGRLLTVNAQAPDAVLRLEGSGADSRVGMAAFSAFDLAGCAGQKEE